MSKFIKNISMVFFMSSFANHIEKEDSEVEINYFSYKLDHEYNHRAALVMILGVLLILGIARLIEKREIPE